MFITDLKCISPQITYEDNFLEGEITDVSASYYNAQEPDYLDFIPKGLLRRMGKAIRMGVGVGLPLVKKHKDIDGIIVGTANGGLEDCIKFLNQIVEYHEGRLTPTNFVQSTPNAIAGQLALMGQNNSYNITYTNGGLSFENALIDGLLLFKEKKANKILVGGIEEISDYNYNIDSLANKYKKEIVSNLELLQSKTAGTICGEGASMFVVENDAKKYYAEIIDVEQITYPSFDELKILVDKILKDNQLEIEDISSLMLGYNGDINHNAWYDLVANEIFPKAEVYTFKQFLGDYRTVSSFALWLSANLLSDKLSTNIPVLQRKGKNEKQQSKKYHLIYNHFDAVRHGLILISN